MIGQFFLFVKNPESSDIVKITWMTWATITPHYGLCSIMDINLQWEDA